MGKAAELLLFDVPGLNAMMRFNIVSGDALDSVLPGGIKVWKSKFQFFPSTISGKVSHGRYEIP